MSRHQIGGSCHAPMYKDPLEETVYIWQNARYPGGKSMHLALKAGDSMC